MINDQAFVSLVLSGLSGVRGSVSSCQLTVTVDTAHYDRVDWNCYDKCFNGRECVNGYHIPKSLLGTCKRTQKAQQVNVIPQASLLLVIVLCPNDI